MSLFTFSVLYHLKVVFQLSSRLFAVEASVQRADPASTQSSSDGPSEQTVSANLRRK